MRSKSNLPIFLTYVAVSLCILGLVVAQLGVTFPWQHPYTLAVDFSETAGIVANNDVDMNGVQVGHVQSVGVDHGTAVARLVIDDPSALPIYKDASAEVRTKNLLGETYIDLQRGSNHCGSCRLPSGSTLTVDHTVPITEIDQVLSIFDPTTVHRVQLILDAAGNGLSNNGENLNSGAGYANQLITSLNGPAVELSVRDQQISDIVLELQRLYDMLAAQRGQVRDEFGTWNQVMQQLADQDTSVAGTLQQADLLLGNLRTLLGGEGSNLQTTLNQLPGALSQTDAFLAQTNDIFANVLQYRGSIHDVFPNLGTSFADTDSSGQHFWSVYAVNCNSSCGGQSPAAYDYGSSPSWGGRDGGIAMTDEKMKHRVAWNAILLVAFAAISIGGMEYLASNMGQSPLLASNYTLNAAFSDADGVASSADVRVSGVDVGKVTAVSRDPAQAGMTMVTMTINDSQAVPVYSNGTVTVRPKTLLGEKYLDLTLGSASGTVIPSGGFLPSSQATKDVSNDEIFNSMDATTRSNLQQVLGALNTATQQRAGDIRAILPNLQTAVANLIPVAQVYSQDQPQVDAILLNLNTTLQTTADENQQLSSLLANGNVALSAIAARDNALVSTLGEAGNVAAEINSAAAPTVAAQQKALGELGPALGSTNTLLNEIVGPQAACGGQSCGIAEVFTGTLTGNLNYPNDQLTVTSSAGNQVTNEWASMFSQPAMSSTSHAALNLVLSEHCDAAAQTLNEVINGLPAAVQQQVQQVCQGVNSHGSSLAPASYVNEAALLLEGSA